MPSPRQENLKRQKPQRRMQIGTTRLARSRHGEANQCIQKTTVPPRDDGGVGSAVQTQKEPLKS